MIIKANDFRKICNVVLAATDNSELSTLTETLELKADGTVLYLNVTNKEYYVSVKFNLDHEEHFVATVNANLFLKLIAAITTEDIDISIHDTHIKIKANGNYKLPLIFEGDSLLQMPRITIENKVCEMDIPSATLNSIVTYNGKHLNPKTAANPVQKLFYMDQEGCITFTNSACVNTFQLEKPVKVLLNSRLVNLFKLFKNTVVHFSLGYDPISDTMIQTKVAFETADIMLTAITGCNDELLNKVPVAFIRDKAQKSYPNNIVLSAAALKEALSRLMLFGKDDETPASTFEFSRDKVTIYDLKLENTEVLNYQNGTIFNKPYDMTLSLLEIKKVLDSCEEEYLTLSFGETGPGPKACVMTRGQIKNVIPIGRVVEDK